MVFVKWLPISMAVLVVLVLALAAFGAARWAGATQALNERLQAAQQPVSPARFDAAAELPGLPAPVQRFFRAALQDGQPIVSGVGIRHRGTFNMAAEGPDRWLPFTSTQQVRTRRQGFVWDGKVSFLPGLSVYVHDAYIAGEGLLRPAVLGLFALADLRGSSPEPGGLAEGEFLRWFAEAAWYPTALLPSQGVLWTPVDDHSARATASDGALSATLLVTFDATSGLIHSARAEARGRTLGKAVVTMPWEGRWSDYASRDGMQVPLRGEVAWLAPEGRRPYWRGEITQLEFSFAP